jgi:hypothetical protein
MLNEDNDNIEVVVLDEVYNFAIKNMFWLSDTQYKIYNTINKRIMLVV